MYRNPGCQAVHSLVAILVAIVSCAGYSAGRYGDMLVAMKVTMEVS